MLRSIENSSKIRKEAENFVSQIGPTKDQFLISQKNNLTQFLLSDPDDQAIIDYFKEIEQLPENHEIGSQIKNFFSFFRKKFFFDLKQFFKNISNDAEAILPSEIWGLTFTFFSFKDQCQAASVCKQFNVLFKNPEVIATDANEHFKILIERAQQNKFLQRYKSIFPALKSYFYLRDKDPAAAGRQLSNDLTDLFTHKALLATIGNIMAKIHDMLLYSFFYMRDFQTTLDICDYLLNPENKKMFLYFQDVYCLYYPWDEATKWCAEVYLKNLQGMAYVKMNQLEAAEKIYFSLINNATLHYALFVNYLRVLRGQGKVEQALQFAEDFMTAQNRSSNPDPEGARIPDPRYLGYRFFLTSRRIYLPAALPAAEDFFQTTAKDAPIRTMRP